MPTLQLTTLRGSVLEDATPTTTKPGTVRGLPLKDALEYAVPELNIHCLRLALNVPRVTEQLRKLDEQGVSGGGAARGWGSRQRPPPSRGIGSALASVPRQGSPFPPLPLAAEVGLGGLALAWGIGAEGLTRGHPSSLPWQLCRKHKVGILYCKAHQSSEEEMYNNEEAGPALEEFLELLGEKVCLRGFGHYAAQLDTKSRSLPTEPAGGSLAVLCRAGGRRGAFPADPSVAALCCSGLHGHALPLHHLPGLRDHVPRLNDAPLHPQQ